MAIPLSPPVSEKPKPPSTDDDDNDDAAFEKELLGLTGGLTGGEKGLQKFIDENPPPSKTDNLLPGSGSSRPKPPELPLFMPGMIVIVKNPANPYHMYTGIVQQITNGKVGVLFKGGNWDKLLTFQLHELQRRDNGPPMVNLRKLQVLYVPASPGCSSSKLCNGPRSIGVAYGPVLGSNPPPIPGHEASIGHDNPPNRPR